MSNEEAVLVKDDKPLEMRVQLDTLRRVVAQFCFDVMCPVCGMELCEGERHECRLVMGPQS